MNWLPPRGLSLLNDSFPLPSDEPFTSAQAETVGVRRHVLAQLVRDGLLRRMLKNVYVGGHVPDSILLRARALALVSPPDAVCVDWTACWLHTGVLPPNDHLDIPPIALFRAPGRGRLRNDLCASGERHLTADDVVSIDGLSTTTPLRTALDLGRLARRDWALAGIDALTRTGAFTVARLVEEVERFRRQRGVVQLREIAPLADPRAESPGESVLRLRWHDLWSLPQPEPQIRILSPSGAEIYRIDLGVEELRFGVEYDGEGHHSSPTDIQHDRRRRADLRDRFDWLVIGVTRHNLFGVGRDIERVITDGVREARRRLGHYRPTG